MWLFSHPRRALQTGPIIPNRVSNATLLLRIMLHLNKLPLFAAVAKICKEFCLYVKPKESGVGGGDHILTSTALMASVFMLYFIAPFRMHSEASAR